MRRTVFGAGATAGALGALVALALVIGTGLQHAPWPVIAPDRDDAPPLDIGVAGDGAAPGGGPPAAVASSADDAGPAAAVLDGVRGAARDAVAIDGVRGAIRDAAALPGAGDLPEANLIPGGAGERRPRPEAGTAPAPGSGRAPSSRPEGGAGTSTPGARPVADRGADGDTARPGTGRAERLHRATREASAEPGTHGSPPGPASGGPAPGGSPPRYATAHHTSGTALTTVARRRLPGAGAGVMRRGAPRRDAGAAAKARGVTPRGGPGRGAGDAAKARGVTRGGAPRGDVGDASARAGRGTARGDAAQPRGGERRTPSMRRTAPRPPANVRVGPPRKSKGTASGHPDAQARAGKRQGRNG